MSEATLTEDNARNRSDEFARRIPIYPGGFQGRGIIICAGGVKYFTSAWVCINMLRKHGCSLPIQLWHLPEEELDEEMRFLVAPLGVECANAGEQCTEWARNRLNGWALKPFSILHSRFQEVLLLDADNVPVVNPEFLFETPEFKNIGAVFWPDYERLDPHRSIWSICGVQYRDEPEFESGQILVDKQKCWRALQLCMWYNQHSEFYYRFVLGDKETFHMAFRKLEQSYSMPGRPIQRLHGTMCQHDFRGNRIFQHRNMAKWSLFLQNRKIDGFLYESECLGYLERLRQLWNLQLKVPRFDATARTETEIKGAKRLAERTFLYLVEGHGYKTIRFQPDGMIGLSAGGFEIFWDLETNAGELELKISSEDKLTARLVEAEPSSWKGQWLVEPNSVELTPL